MRLTARSVALLAPVLLLPVAPPVAGIGYGECQSDVPLPPAARDLPSTIDDLTGYGIVEVCLGVGRALYACIYGNPGERHRCFSEGADVYACSPPGVEGGCVRHDTRPPAFNASKGDLRGCLNGHFYYCAAQESSSHYDGGEGFSPEIADTRTKIRLHAGTAIERVRTVEAMLRRSLP